MSWSLGLGFCFSLNTVHKWVFYWLGDKNDSWFQLLFKVCEVLSSLRQDSKWTVELTKTKCSDIFHGVKKSYQKSCKSTMFYLKHKRIRINLRKYLLIDYFTLTLYFHSAAIHYWNLIWWLSSSIVLYNLLQVQKAGFFLLL